MEANVQPLGYLAAIRSFSRNARLYILHVIGMDVIHGAWEVLFNLYLFIVLSALGWTAAQVVAFVGLRLFIGYIVGAAAAIPAGWVSDRVGRKWGFIIGDGFGAFVALINVLFPLPAVVLGTVALDYFLSALHHVSEPPFMAENSRPAERVHLFSVASGVRTFAAMSGALIAGYMGSQVGPLLLDFFRLALFIGIAGWFLSLAPAFLMRRIVGEVPRGFGFLRNVRNPGTIARLVTTDALLGLGAAATIPFVNLFFNLHLHAMPFQIGLTFALGYALLALGSFAAPLLTRRLTKVEAVFMARAFSIPFILLLGFAAELGNPVLVLLTLGSIAYIGRISIMNMSGPLWDAFSMEVLDPAERGTAVGIDTATSQVLGAVGAFLGSWLMARGDYTGPYILMAVAYGLSTALVLLLFRPLETRAPTGAPETVLVSSPGPSPPEASP